MTSIEDIEGRQDLLDARLRRVLDLLVNAPIKSTTIPDSQGSFMGHDYFISPELREKAEALLDEWDEENGPGDDAFTEAVS